MTAFLIYAIRWAVVLTLLYSLYALFLKRETLHNVNRIVLLVILVASMILPLCQIRTNETNAVAESRELLEQQIITVSSTGFSPVAQQMDDAPKQQTDFNIVILLLITIYVIGVAIAWVRYLWSMASLLLFIRRSERIEVAGLPKGVKVLTLPSVTTPCSWMHWMLLSPADAQARPIILHELAHIQLRHSWDMLLCELTCRTLWCVPFAWMLRQDLRDVHEYQADRHVLKSGINDEEYQLLLIRKATGTGLQPVVNAFNQSPIKRRFKMMYKKPSRRWVALKAAYLLPLSALTLVAFARPQALIEIEEKVEKEVRRYTAAMKPLVSSTTNPDASSAEAVETLGIVNLADLIGQDSALPDSNLVKADLQDNNLILPAVQPTTSVHGAAVLDSVMQAVGARKIAEGTYIGHFQPSLNNDTVRLAQVEILNKESVKVFEQAFPQNASDPYAYKMTLQAATRKDETGHYIRFLTPVKATDRNYDLPKYDPKLVLHPTNLLKFSISSPAAIERTKQETRVFMYAGVRYPHNADYLRGHILYPDAILHDADSNDKYMFRSMDDSYLKFVQQEVYDKDTINVYQICLVFPPLAKKVKRAWIGTMESDGAGTTFWLRDIPRKGKIITH